MTGIGSGSRLLRWSPLVVAGIALLVFGLWYWNPGYRYDEYLVAVARSRISWSRLLGIITTTDPGPGLLYVLMKPWAGFSSDPWWTRLPSLVAMAVSVGALVALVRQSVDGETAVLAGLVMIALPATSRWAQDNRMYALATASIVLATACWWRSVTGGPRRWSVAYGAGVFAMGWFHLYALAVVPALVLAALWVPGPRRSTLVRTIVPPVVAALVLLPHIYLNFVHPTGSPSNPPASVESIARVVALTFGVLPGPLIVLLGVIGAVWAWRQRQHRAVVVLGIAWVLLPLMGYVIARAVLGMPTLTPRYYVFAIPGGCLLAALGLRALGTYWRPATLIALGLVIALAIPEQIAVRAADSHNAETFRLGLILRRPELAGLPVLAVNGSAAWTIDAATYPDTLVTPSSATPQPVAVVVKRRGGSFAQPGDPYLQPGAPWQPLVRCTPGDVVTIEVVALPDASLPTGSAGALARQLNEGVPDAGCMPVP